VSEPVIQVENLGKKYIISHEQPERYTALRDVLSKQGKAIARTLLSPFHKTPPRRMSKREEFWALQHVTFSVEQGEVIGIIGRNGAGKSTLLKILSRITEPTIGRIALRGRVASLLEVGTGFHPELTGRENIYLNGAILGMTRTEIRRKFDEIVAFAEVERFLDTPVKRYSSGMYVRLAFAVAANLEPEILLVDEVLAVGDAAFQQKCLGKMGEVATQRGRTVFFVSHNMAMIQRLCTSVILLNQGQIQAWGDAATVTEQYLQQGVATSLCWERSTPPDQDIYFKRIYLSDQTSENIEYVTTASTVQVVMEFVVGRNCPSLQLSVDILDNSGEIIFASSPLDAQQSLPKELGTYRARFHLPPELFMAKNYGIRCALWVPFLGVLDTVNSLRFLAHETASLCNSTPQGRLGMIALRCNWQIEQV
jgi:lipopolysaccharide transport system ATP-binding protein